MSPTGGAPSLRRATPQDAPAISGLVAAGMATYRAFAPPGWAPPTAQREAHVIAARLRSRGTWATVAHAPSLERESCRAQDRQDSRSAPEAGAEGALVGVVGFVPHEQERALAHFWLLFVAEPDWGSGLAARLHARAVDAARGAGYARMRLFTPEGQARARAFYVREGWRPHGAAAVNLDLGLSLVELRRGL